MKAPQTRIRHCRAVALLSGTFALVLSGCSREPGASGQSAAGQRAAVPVAVGRVERGPIELKRTFSGTLEPPTEFVVAPKVAGRIERLHVDLADVVRRGQVVAELDDEEYRQAVVQAEAAVAVARAELTEAQSTLEIASRELDRMIELRNSGIASESQFDTATISQLAAQADAEVARAEISRAEASLESARIRLGYTKIQASWTVEGQERVVAARFADPGDTVAPNTPLLAIVGLDPLNAVIFVTETDYGYLSPGGPATMRTDAFPARTFESHIARVAPVFSETSRQARVELEVENPDHLLKPGMFVRAQLVLDRVEDTTIVPVDAVSKRDGTFVVFVVNPDGETVSMRPVTVGIEDQGRVQVTGIGVDGRVVTLGQQLLEDGSRIVLTDQARTASAAG